MCRIGGDPAASGRAITDAWHSKLITNGLCEPNKEYVNIEAFDFFRNKINSLKNSLIFDEGIYEVPLKTKNKELINRIVFK